VSKNDVYMVGNICVSPFSDTTLTYKLAHIFHMLCSPYISNFINSWKVLSLPSYKW